MMRRALVVLLLALALPVSAQEAAPGPQVSDEAVPEDVRALFEALRLPEIIDIMSAEGIADGLALGETIFQTGPAPATWTEVIGSIHDPEHMKAEVLASLAEALEGEDTAAMRAFFESEPGRTLIAREVETRQAMADEEVEQEAREAAAVALAERTPRLELLRRYVETLDLVEYNVVGTMNSNYAYVTGLLDGGAIRGEMTEEDVLSDIWAQEGQVRANATEWIFSFLLEAYEPASDADLEALIRFSETEEGQALNRALFDAFDVRFSEMSRALGLAAARHMTTREL